MISIDGFGPVPNTGETFFPFDSMDDRVNSGYGATWLYRYFDMEGSLLYVGISKHPAIRDEQHWWKQTRWRETAATMRLDLFPSRHEAEYAEKLAIHIENPFGNWKRLPLDKSDRSITRVPSGIRTIWADVTPYYFVWEEPSRVLDCPHVATPATSATWHPAERQTAPGGSSTWTEVVKPEWTP